ncbi:MAG: glycoside hydrolase family 3 C-terminal domain-containing protein [Candidatus Marinimicrobia bacterium]|nr:glycoside hydrolase family 3 C-terminal domain-containing protein [Candidatus Neomarinimicrobiota bacterium]MCF7850393.1 glycoside hydrolase family 3 C-terminal domain-containing protein [Candidatus Neomarinimicrobiota bacterium]
MIILSALILLIGCNTTEPVVKPVSIEDKSVESIVEMMTLAEKVGQMTQVDRRYLDDLDDISKYHLGSLLSGGGSTPDVNDPAVWADMVDEYQSIAKKSRLGIPLIYGIDAVHGHNNVIGATIVPHNIGLGATRNEDLVRQLGWLTAREVRATGINWTFAPCVANSRDERWGRAYESFGEDPALISAMGKAQVEGFQGADLSDPEAIAACTKHYIGDGAPTWSTGLGGMIDRGDAQLDESRLRALHLAPYIAAIEAGTATIMASYNSWNGEALHGHKYLLTDVLKGELGFEGFIVSDWAAIDSLAPDYKGSIIQSINAGLDMIMVPGQIPKSHSYKEFISLLTAAVNEGSIPMSRIDDAVTRILRIKEQMGLLNADYANDRSLLPTVGSEEHRAIARQAVAESIVMLENENNTLPLSKNATKIVLAGRGADNVGMQCGGWTISWQGGHGAITDGTSILQAVESAVSEATEVILSEDGSNSQGADAVIVVVGEDPYAEMHGDRRDLSLSQEDLAVINAVKQSGSPMILVLLSGRPMIITDILDSSDAFLAAWLPGTEGAGVADVLFGDHAPSGKLSVTWPTSMDQIPINDRDTNYNPLFPFGYGLSY